MTRQWSERLILNGETKEMETYPLSDWDHCENLDMKIHDSINSGCWRGYVGTWKIEHDKLFLIWVEPSIGQPDEPVTSDDYVEIFADWYSGTLHVLNGEILGHPTSQPKSTDPIFIKIENGNVVDTWTEHHELGSKYFDVEKRIFTIDLDNVTK